METLSVCGGSQVVGNIMLLSRDRIRPFQNQPRKYFSKPKLKELADSISEMGQVTPIMVKRIVGDDKYDWELVNGERRYLACGIANVREMKAIEETLEDENAQHLLSVVANFCQEFHTPIEVANAIKRIKDDYGYTEEKIGRIIGKSNWWVNVYFHLLDLHPEIQDMLNPDLPKKQQLGISVAIYVSSQEKDQQKQLAMVNEIMKHGLNTGQARAHIRAQTEVARERLRKAGHVKGRKPSDDHRIFQTFLARTMTGLKMHLNLGEEKIKKLFEHRPFDDRQESLNKLIEISGSIKKLCGIIDDLV